MKNSYMITIIFLIISITGYCQIEKVEHFILGTKVTFYMGACETSIPEANNKLSFCDEANNLGVVEKSYGLLGGVRKMIPNHFNNDEVFLTQRGYSILKEDGTWFNIPEDAIPTNNLSGSMDSQDGIVTSDGKLLFGDESNRLDSLVYLDLNTLEFEFFNVNDDYHAKRFAYDTATNTTYVLAESFSDMRLYSINGNNITSEGIIANLPDNVSDWNNLTLSNGFIYTGRTDLYKIDVTNPSNVSIDDLSDLPFEGITGFDVDSGGNVWMSLNGGFADDGGIVKYNPVTEVFEINTLAHTNGLNFGFDDIAIAENGEIWTTTDSYFEDNIVIFSPDNTDPWTILPAEDLVNFGFSMESSPRSISNLNQNLYLTFPEKFKVLKYKDGNWTGITDRTPENIDRFSVGSTSIGGPHNLVPAKDGGMWSYNRDNYTLFKFEGNDFKKTEAFTPSNLSGDRFIIDVDGKPTSVGGSSSRIIKYNEPIVEEGSPLGYSPRSITSFEDKLWIRDQFSTLHVILEDNEIANYPLTNYDDSQITPDSEGNIIYSKIDADNNEFTIYQYDVTNDIENTFNYPFNFNDSSPTNSKIIQISLENGKMVFLYEEVMILFDNGMITDITFESLGFDSSANVFSAVADELGNLVMFIDDQLVRILDPFGSINVESYILRGFDDTLLPEVDYSPYKIALDTEGAIWAQIGSTWTKITLENANPSSPFFENSRIKGTVYYDKNNNNNFDAGEEAANQRMALTKNGEQAIRYTYTNENGNYEFLYQGTGDYTVSALGSNPYNIAEIPFIDFNITDVSTDTDLNLIKLELNSIESLLVKSSEKLGAWGFEREGFDNNFTTAIGNISGVKTFTNLDFQFIYQNDDESSDNVLPQINEVVISEVISNNITPVIFNTLINPKNHFWHINRSTSEYTVNTLSITPIITENDDKVTVDFTVPQLSPNNMIIVEVKVDLFAPEQNGTAIAYGLSSISGDNIGEFDDPATVTLIPRQDDNLILDFPENLPPEINPLNPLPPSIPDKSIFAPNRNRTEIFSSYDPNDKLVSPGLPNVLNEVDINTPFLTYTIRFENEGNFSAKDVYILDELDENIDFNSIQLIEASHEVAVDQLEIDGKTNLRFFFENIFLDFTDNDPIASQGYVKFAVRPVDNIQENTIIENTAAIYFDQNPPIITNTTQHKFMVITMSNEDFLDESLKVKAFPNPVSDYLHLNLPKKGDYGLQVYDIMGKQIMQEQYKNQSSVLLPFNNFSKGQYIIKITNAENSTSVKIIKN